METVELNNVGPIESFKLELDEPGIYELRGSKGTGKTTVLHSLDLISGNKVDLTIHDGEIEGSIVGLGVVKNVARGGRMKGDITVDTIDNERFDLVDLVDPDGVKPETRDSRRIKALATLSKLRLAPHDFYEIAGGEDAYTALGVALTYDPIMMASRVKAALDREAKKREDAAHEERAHSLALAEQADGVDLDQPSDPEVLADLADKASSELAALLQRQESYEQQEAAREEARKRLAEAESSYDGLTVREAQKAVDLVREKHDGLDAEVRELEKQLAAAMERRQQVKVELDSVNQELTAAKQHESNIQKWKESLELEGITPPTEKELEYARSAKEGARRAQEQGVRIRDAKKALELSEQHRQKSLEYSKEAEDYRSRASSAFDVLTERMDTRVIRVESVAGTPRLVVDHPKRGATLFEELSDGEKVLAALKEILPHLGSPGLFVIPQRIHQDLPPADRKMLGEYAREHGIYVIGAQVTDDELHVVKL